MIKLPNSNKGKIVKELVQNIDIYPTVLDVLGIDKPKNITLHGHSLTPLLNKDKVNWENVAYTCAVGNYGLVTDRYRFTKLKDGGYHLFDLKKDPYEWNNLAGNIKYKKRIQEFEAKLETVVWNTPK